MIPQEFKIQFFKTRDQWEKGGLMYSLDALKEGGFTLSSNPSFEQWIIQKENGINNPVGLAIDECSRVYLMDSDARSKLCRLYRYEPGSKYLEQLSYIDGCCPQTEELQCPERMILERSILWVNDKANHRVLAFSRENYQIKFVLDRYFLNGKEELINPIDIGLDSHGLLFVLDKKSNKNQIVTFDTNGSFIKPPYEIDLDEPVGLAFGSRNEIWVIDGIRLLRFIEKDSKLISNFSLDLSTISKDFMPSYIVIDRTGKIFISDKNKGFVHGFDPDGSYSGMILGFSGQVNGLSPDPKNNLYISNSKGICKLSTQETFTKEAGIYYSKALDSGIIECQWHRIELQAVIPDKALLEIYYSASDDTELKANIEKKFAEDIPVQEKARFLDEQLKWSLPEKNPRDMLFREKKGRYLWLKLKLLTFDEKVRPVVKRMRVLYPRISYLRYLPAIYQDDPISKEFLDRFLSIFETAFYDLETTISHIYKYFDPDAVPQDFLNWLASWLNVALEEEWPENKKRRFVREAYSLYKSRGTPSCIEKIIGMYTGKKPLIMEHPRIGKPMVLNGAFRMGVNTFLIQAPVRGFRLGSDSILGKVAIRDTVQLLEDPFLPLAFRFTIILDLSPEEARIYEKGLKRIIEREKPAHTEYKLRFASNIGVYIGMNTRLDHNLHDIRIGITSSIGSGIVLKRGDQGGIIEQHSRIEQDTLLI